MPRLHEAVRVRHILAWKCQSLEDGVLGGDTSIHLFPDFRHNSEEQNPSSAWWHTSLVPAHQKQRKADLSEFRLSSRTAKVTERNPDLTNRCRELERENGLHLQVETHPGLLL